MAASIYVDGGVDLDDVLAAQFAGDYVGDHGHRRVQVLQPQQAVQFHSAARGDVVDDDAVPDGINVHNVPASFKSIKIRAMRIYLPFSTCLK